MIINNGISIILQSLVRKDDDEDDVQAVHTKYPQYSYEQVLYACREISPRHQDHWRTTLGRVFLGVPSYVKEFEEIIAEQGNNAKP